MRVLRQGRLCLQVPSLKTLLLDGMRETLQRRMLASHAPVHDVIGSAIHAQEAFDEQDVETEWRTNE